MSAKLKQIRAAIADRLRNRIPAVGDAVSTNRADEVWDRHLPAIVVYTKSETLERVEQAPPSYDCTARVVVEVLASDVDGSPMDDQLDDVCQAVRDLLFLDPRLSVELPDMVRDAKLVSVDSTVEDGGERLIAGARMTWEYVYVDEAPEGDPADLWPLKTVHTDYSLDDSRTPPIA